MQKIAFERFGIWFNEGWDEYSRAVTNMIPWGAVVLGLRWVPQVFTFPANIAMDLAPAAGAVFFVIGALLGMVCNAVGECVITGAALARHHGRNATFEDVRQDLGTHVQAVLAVVFSGFIIALVAVIASAPGIGLIVAGVRAEDGFMVAIGVVLLIVLALPTVLTAYALLFFVVPLVVDKHLDFWSAITQSIDCTRRDFLGVLLFSLVFGLLFGVASILEACTCSIAVLFTTPFFAILKLRAYRDYFGLEEDRIAAAHPDIVVSSSAPPPTMFSSYDQSFRPGGGYPQQPPPYAAPAQHTPSGFNQPQPWQTAPQAPPAEPWHPGPDVVPPPALPPPPPGLSYGNSPPPLPPPPPRPRISPDPPTDPANPPAS